MNVYTNWNGMEWNGMEWNGMVPFEFDIKLLFNNHTTFRKPFINVNE